jgi:hypothetical protein
VRCGVGSWGGRCPNLGGYIEGTGAASGVTPPDGVDLDYPPNVYARELPSPLADDLHDASDDASDGGESPGAADQVQASSEPGHLAPHVLDRCRREEMSDGRACDP